MGLKLDVYFEKDLETCFGGKYITYKNIVDYYQKKFDENKGFVTDVMNTVITSNTIGYTYSQCFEELNNRLDVGDIYTTTKLLVVCIIIVLYKTDPVQLRKYVKLPRDVYGEFCEITGMSKDEIKESSSSSKYSIVDLPVSSWDEYFFDMCRRAARNSKCLSRRIGAVLVRDKLIISTGYNGPPNGIPPCDVRWDIDNDFYAKYADKLNPDNEEEKIGKCPRQIIGFKSGKGMDICPAAHAEENTILTCAYEGTSTKGTTMYMNCGIPCGKCMIKIIRAGIKELVVIKFSFYDELSKYLLENSDIKVRLYDFIK